MKYLLIAIFLMMLGCSNSRISYPMIVVEKTIIGDDCKYEVLTIGVMEWAYFYTSCSAHAVGDTIVNSK